MSLAATGQSNMLRFLRNRNIFDQSLAATSSSCRFWADEFGLKPKQISQPVFSILALRFA
jgi:hypothetical protein